MLDYQGGGNLHEYIKDKQAFSEVQTKMIIEQLLLALDFLHQNNVIHRDIKLDNILINAIVQEEHINVRIADFGLAIFVSPDPECKLFYKCGTPCYIAPEILRGKGYRENADIFSLGSVFFNLLTGCYLFNASDPANMIILNE